MALHAQRASKQTPEVYARCMQDAQELHHNCDSSDTPIGNFVDAKAFLPNIDMDTRVITGTEVMYLSHLLVCSTDGDAMPPGRCHGGA